MAECYRLLTVLTDAGVGFAARTYTGGLFKLQALVVSLTRGRLWVKGFVFISYVRDPFGYVGASGRYIYICLQIQQEPLGLALTNEVVRSF